MQLELITKIIGLIESPRMNQGNSIYYKISDNTLSMGDESLIRVICYEENKLDGQDDEFHEKIEAIHKGINNTYDADDYYQKLHQESGFHYYFRGARMDTIEVKITDNHLYVIEFRSGQY